MDEPEDARQWWQNAVDESPSEAGDNSAYWDRMGQSVDRAVDQQHRAMEDSTSWDDLPLGTIQTGIDDTVRDALDGWRSSESESESETDADSEPVPEFESESGSETDSADASEFKDDEGTDDDAGGGCVIS